MATAQAFDARALEPLQYGAYEVHAHTRACALQIRKAEQPGLLVDGPLDQRSFLAARRLDLAGALLQFLARLRENKKQEIHGWPWIVQSFVPALRTLLEHFVVALPVFLDQALQADIAADLQAAMVTAEQKQQARDPAIAITKRMNAQKIQIERRNEDQRRNPSLDEAALPELNHFRHRLRRSFGGDRLEANAAAAIGVSLNNVHVLIFVTAGIPDLAAAEAVQLFYRGLREGKFRAGFVNKLQRVAVAAHLLLVAIAQGGPAEDECAHARFVHFDALDAIRGNGAFDQRVFPQHLQLLRRLPGVELELALGLAQVREIPARARGDVRRFGRELAKGHHASLSINHRLQLIHRIPQFIRAIEFADDFADVAVAPNRSNFQYVGQGEIELAVSAELG